MTNYNNGDPQDKLIDLNSQDTRQNSNGLLNRCSDHNDHQQKSTNENDKGEVSRNEHRFTHSDASPESQPALSIDNAQKTLAAMAESSRLPRLDPFKYNTTDIGNGERFVDLFAGQLLFCALWKSWLVFSGKRWQQDKALKIDGFAVKAVRAMYHEAGDIKGDTDDDKRRRIALGAWAKRCEAKKYQNAMVDMAKHALPVEPDELDRNHWLFNVENGTLDLKTGKLKPHDHQDKITNLAPVNFDPQATCLIFDRFIDEIMLGDKQLVKFLQEYLGCCLTGEIKDEFLVLFVGGGQNGKSTLLNLIVRLLGDYAAMAPSNLLMQERFSSHPTEKVILFGKRFVACSETEEGKFDMKKVKEFTSRETIQVRRMGENFWPLTPTHKLLLATNHRPQITANDDGIWRRQKLVPFNYRIPDDKKDPDFGDKLWAERSGILNWLIEGCLAWQKQSYRFSTSKTINESVEAWREESDVLAPFLDAHCVIDQMAKEESARLYEWYKGWAESQGDRAITKTAFGKRLSERGFSSGKGKGGLRYWLGLRIDETKHARDNESGGGFSNAPPTNEKNKSLQNKENDIVENMPKVARFDQFASPKIQFGPHEEPTSKMALNAPLAPPKAQGQPENQEPDEPPQPLYEYRFFDDKPASKPSPRNLWAPLTIR